MINEYIKHLINLVNIERDSERESMLYEISTLTAEERERKGRAVNNLKGKFIKKEFDLSIAKFSSFDDIKTEINIGDLVLISKGNPLRSDLIGIVTEKRLKSIFVGFEGFIPDWVFNSEIRMDLSVNDVTFSRMENNLKQILTQSDNSGRLAIKYALENYKPGHSSKRSVSFKDNSLNKIQKEAIAQSLGTTDFFLIHGPFGTGKTKTLVELIYQEVKNGNKVLVTAESNAAVDNIVERLVKINNLDVTRLGHPQKVSEEIIGQTVFGKFEKHESYSKIKRTKKELDRLFEELYKIKGKAHSKSRQHFLMAEISRYKEILSQTEEIIKEDIINKSQVILTTNSSAALEEILYIYFDVAIIDEASQTTIPSILIPIAKAKRFILAGDHKQLPPTVLSESAKELEITLFEKLIDKYPDKKQLLNVQFRMNEKLMRFPNSEFYNNELICDNHIKNISIDIIRKNLDLDNPIVFIDTSKHHKFHETKLKYSKSYINKLEADLALKIVNDYLKLGINEQDIGIISPYSDQVSRISNKTNVEVKTVDGFQGREKEIIIISTVRSNKKGNIGFLRDLRRLNVAITRAKKKLIIIGNSKTLKHNDTYKRLIDYCRAEDCIIELKNELEELEREEKIEIEKKLERKQKKLERKQKEKRMLFLQKRKEMMENYGMQKISPKVREEVFKRANNKCNKCGASGDEALLDIDYIVLPSKGGNDHIKNLQVICEKCNIERYVNE